MCALPIQKFKNAKAGRCCVAAQTRQRRRRKRNRYDLPGFAGCIALPMVALFLAFAHAVSAQLLGLPPFGAAQAFSTPPCDLCDLVGWWPLDAISSTTTPDLSGFGNTMTALNSPSVVAGIISNGVKLVAGSSQVLTNETQADFPYGNSPRTISFWFQQLVSGSAQMFFEYGQVGGGYPLEIYFDGSSHILVYPPGTGFSWSPNTNKHFFVMTFDGADQIDYFDGVAQATNMYAMHTVSNGTPCCIGAYFLSGSYGYNVTATMDDVRLYTNSQSAAWVGLVYTNGLSGQP